MNQQPRQTDRRITKRVVQPPDRDVIDGTAARKMTWAETQEMLTEIAERLDPDCPVELVVAGGTAMTAAGLREATVDVDVVAGIPPKVLDSALEIAEERNLSPHWMNTSATAFVPSDRSTRQIFEHGPLTVLAVSPDDLFIMKIDAARPRDIDDLRALWPHCSYETAEQAAADYESRTPLARRSTTTRTSLTGYEPPSQPDRRAAESAEAESTHVSGSATTRTQEKHDRSFSGGIYETAGADPTSQLAPSGPLPLVAHRSQ